MDDADGIAERETGIMTAAQPNVYRASERCPVCGSRRSGTATGMLAGALPVMRAFYACGYTVTAAGTPSGRVVIMGVGCRGRKAVTSV
jgi:hypothetical protein